MHWNRFTMLAVVGITVWAVGAVAGPSDICPPADNSTATLAAPWPGPYSLMVIPDGTGPSFTAGLDGFGNEVDVTITYTLRDCTAVPIPNFPAEDMWLETDDGGLVACIGGTTADANTDAEGRTTWTNPPRAGGSSTAGCRVMVSGSPGIWGTLPLHFNSPDLNADGNVNLVDVPIFATDYFGGLYRYRSDFHFDGQVNLVDLVLFAGALGASCP